MRHRSDRLSLGLSAAAVFFLALGRASAASPTIFDLGTLGGNESGAYAINASGQITGYSVTANGSSHAFLYSGKPGSGGSMIDIDTLGAAQSCGRGINASGQVTGYVSISGVLDKARAFRYSAGAMVDLGLFPYPSSRWTEAYGINSAGQIAGGGDVSIWSTAHAFIYSGTPGAGGRLYDLTKPSDAPAFNQAIAINDSGQVAGYQFVRPNYHAFLYTGTPDSAGPMLDLGTLGGTSLGFAINGSGQVAGKSAVANGDFHAFLYTGTPGNGGHMDDLGSLGGTDTQAWAINSSGQVAGYGYTPGNAEYHAFLYVGTPGSGGNMIDLDTWLDSAMPAEGVHWTLNYAYGLNDSGMVVGTGTYDGATRAFLLDASGLVPEPTGLSLGAPAAIYLLSRRRRLKQS